jgi:hypothetical protein
MPYPNDAPLFPDFAQELNAKTQADLAATVGAQTIALTQSAAAATILGNRVVVLEQKLEELKAAARVTVPTKA